MPPAAVDVVLPCLDEAAALPALLSGLPAGYRAIVVDNGLTDDSARVATAAGATVVHEPVRGYGAACHLGLTTATADVVAFCDADGSIDPGALPRLVEPVLRHDADLTVGRRVPTTPTAWPRHAQLANRFLAHRVSSAAGLSLHDIGPVRVARRGPLVGLAVRDRRFGYPLETLLRAGAAGWRVVELDVAYHPRVGRSKVTGTLVGTLRAVRDMTAVMAQRSVPEPGRAT